MKRSSLTSGKESILVVDDDPGVLRYARGLLDMAGYRVETATCGSEAVQRLKNGAKPDLILIDIAMPDMDGLQTIEACRQVRPQQKIVVLSCVTTPSVVAEAIRLGALDYLSKPFYKSDLDAMMSRWLAPVQGCVHGDASNCESIDSGAFFVAASPAMKKIRGQISQLARVDIPVLLLGESGVGKEVMARLIHKLSPRAQKPLIKVNCAAIPAELLESELFGYEAGAFTGATRTKPGMFELCDQGTILLDEIGEMSTALQAKLLHVLQDGQFTRLGSRTTIAAEFRVLAATNIDIHEAMENGAFREDLFYRLNAFTVEIPPLRERLQEISFLVDHFVSEFSLKYGQAPPQYSQRLIHACMQYRWPGNLRELGNFVKRFVVFQDEEMAIAELADKTRELAPEAAGTRTDAGSGTDLKSMMKDLKHSAEIKVIEEALISTNWNRKRAALKLKISCKALRYKIKQYQLTPLPQVSLENALSAMRNGNG